jgi:hypothetical protein
MQFFSDFEDFANVVNWWLADPDVHPDNPWRLQELPKSELLKLGDPEYPTYGRLCFTIKSALAKSKLDLIGNTVAKILM